MDSIFAPTAGITALGQRGLPPIVAAFFLLLSAASPFITSANANSPTEERGSPNIVFILADDK